MARLNRQTQKIFGGNSAENQITTFGSIKAGAPVYSKSVEDIQTPAFTQGWTSAVGDDNAPYRQDVNAIDFVFTRQLAYLLQEGIPEWDVKTTYYKGSVIKKVKGEDYQIYHSLKDDNLGNQLTDSSVWKLDFDSAKGYAFVDFSNALPSKDFINKSINWVLPDYSAGIGMGGESFNCPNNGWYVSVQASDNYNQGLEIYINGLLIAQGYASAYANFSGVVFPVSKGDVVSWKKAKGNLVERMRFYPCKGVR